MPTPTWNLDWLVHNGQRKYPLTLDSTCRDDSDSFEIPTDFILGLDLPTHTGLDVSSARFFIKHIGAYAGGYSIIVGYQPAAGDAINVASALIPRPTHTRYTTYALGGIGDFSDTVGKVTIGNLDNIDQQPPGFWTFSLANARLEPDAIRPMLRGVAALVVVNGDQRSAPLYGDIELVAGANILLVPIVESGKDPVIRISAISGEGTIEDCACEGDAAQIDPIKTVNGVPPTPTGDFNLIGSDCVQIVPITNGLRLVNTCSKPCCGCDELERITEDLERLKAQATTVQAFVDRLLEATSVMDTIVLASRIGDRGCCVN